jgi:hypothetical protein
VKAYFELGAPDGLRPRFLADAAEFESWLLELAGELSGEYPPAALAKLADISLCGAAALKTAHLDEACLIDRLMHDYWIFCTMTARHGEQDVTPATTHCYPMELARVLPAASREVCEYYRRLFAGDTLAECSDHTYRSADGVFRWSWLLPHEVADFCDRLQDHAHSESEDTIREILALLRLAKDERSSLLISLA